MKLKIISNTKNIEKIIEKAGRNCYSSKCGDLSIIRKWIKAGHESTLEHGSVTFEIKGVSRVLMAQLTRHRLASYCITSQRYVSQEKFDCRPCGYGNRFSVCG